MGYVIRFPRASVLYFIIDTKKAARDVGAGRMKKKNDHFVWPSTWQQQPVIKSMTKAGQKKYKRTKEVGGGLEWGSSEETWHGRKEMDVGEKCRAKRVAENYQSRRATRHWQVPCWTASIDTGQNPLEWRWARRVSAPKSHFRFFLARSCDQHRP